MEKQYYVYILAGRRNGALYTGITSNLIKRVWEHKEKAVDGFNKKYNIEKLVYFEQYQDSVKAISREKLNLIEEENPHWKDLYKELASGYPG
jgi:putative endonuclease